MFKILIVEDDLNKLRDIINIIKVIEGINENDITCVVDGNDAKRHLKANQFDLLILDISIPGSKSKEVDPRRTCLA